MCLCEPIDEVGGFSLYNGVWACKEVHGPAMYTDLAKLSTHLGLVRVRVRAIELRSGLVFKVGCTSISCVEHIPAVGEWEVERGRDRGQGNREAERQRRRRRRMKKFTS